THPAGAAGRARAGGGAHPGRAAGGVGAPSRGGGGSRGGLGKGGGAGWHGGGGNTRRVCWVPAAPEPGGGGARGGCNRGGRGEGAGGGIGAAGAMTLRTRVTVAAGVAVLLAAVATSVTVYLAERDSLRGQVDKSLIEDARSQRHDTATGQHGSPAEHVPEHVPLVSDAFMQVVGPGGGVVTVFDNRRLPVTATVLAVARGERTAAFFDTKANGASVRVYATATAEGALEVGRSLAEVQQTLRRLAWTLAAISVGAVALATLLGRLVAAVATGPGRRVAAAADTIAHTRDLSHHIAVPGKDDLGRLAVSFNTMLDALDESLAAQRQLVADASHELRTPLATVRTNVEVLARGNELDPAENATLLDDTVAQLAELTTLVEDLV